jgi:hypothetical protein
MVDKHFCSLNSNSNSLNAGTTGGFVKNSAVSSSDLSRAGNVALWRIFKLDC